MKNKKNGLIVVLVCIIGILCLVAGWLLGSKFYDIENNNNSQEKIEFIGDKNTEVTYNPVYATSYNLNYKINESGKLVFKDLNNQNNTITYNSIKGICKYVVMAQPVGKLEPKYHIAVITEEGNVYYKTIYAYADLNSEGDFVKYASLNDNFIELKTSNDYKFNGISIKNNLTGLQDSLGTYERIIISSIDGKEYYVSDTFELKELN